MFYTTRQRNLLRELVAVQFLLKEQTTFLGIFWSLLHPLLMLTLLLVVFGYKMGDTVEHFGAYLLVGVVHFTYFANATSAAMHSLYNMRSVAQDAVFPKELIVIGTILSRTTEYLMSLVVCIAIAAITGVQLTGALFFLPVIVVLHILLVVWVSLLLSFAYLFVKDIEHLFQVVLRMLFFMTPIFYEISFLGDGLPRALVLLNPLTHMVAFARAVILDGDLPSFGLFTNYLLANAFFVWLSLKLFRRVEPAFAENL